MARGEFGPQGDAADRFLEALDRLDTPAIVALGAAGGGVVGTDDLDPQVLARTELRTELREIARRAGRLDAVRAIGQRGGALGRERAALVPGRGRRHQRALDVAPAAPRGAPRGP